MRVAVAQFATSLKAQESLASCIRMIDEVAQCEPELIVLPEYCNTLPWYLDHNQAWQQALAIDGDFLHTIMQQAKKHNCYIVLNVTLRRDHARVHQDGAIKSNISVTSCLLSPLGELIQQVDKQTLSQHETEYFTAENEFYDIAETPFGKLGLMAGSDGASYQAPRDFALSGAQLLCRSGHSFSLDQTKLLDLARAWENKVFLATANKVGALIPAQALAESAISAAESLIPEEYLVGVGQSQIIAPDGKLLATIPHQKEGFAFADIDLALAGLAHKLRPDGSELIKQLRPALYKIPTNQQEALDEEGVNVPETVNVAIFATYKSNQQAIEDVCHYIENNLSDIIQLPELFFIDDKAATNNTEKLNEIASVSSQVIKKISAVLRPLQYVCTSLVINGTHQAVLINEDGIFASQQQLHFCERYQWTALGEQLNIITLPLEQGLIKLTMLTGDDANIPEIVKAASVSGIQVLLVPFDIQEPQEVEFSLIAHAAESRVCLVAASREKSFSNEVPTEKPKHKNKIKPLKSTGFIANLPTDLALLKQIRSTKFNGYLNKPLVKYQQGKITKAVIFPIAAVKRTIQQE